VVLCSLLFIQAYADDSILLGGISGLDVEVDLKNGTYVIYVDNNPWFSSASTGFFSGGNWYTTASGTLKLVSSTPVKGSDGTLGDYTGVDIAWTGGDIPFHTIFQSFSNGAIVFNQYYPNGVPATSVNTNEDVIGSFPTLANSTNLYFYTYSDWPLTAQIGTWPNGFPANIQGGSPALFYNNQLRSVLFSPLNNYMIGMQAKSGHFDKNLAFGLNGKIEQIPAGFMHRTILTVGQGLNETFYNWGSILLDYAGKPRTLPDADVLIQYLGYWTDNGAYYYYITEPNKTYSETMIDVYKYVVSTGLPIKSYQFDSWWYFKGINDGVSLWEPMPSIFPEGMGYVDENMDHMPLALHNRYFSPDNQYQKNFSFIIEPTIALPMEEALFTYIMNKAKGWGMVLYEQDWLVTTYMTMDATQNNVTNARNWLLNMGNAAKALGLTIQYCMPLPLHELQSVEVTSVTQSRVTGDYQPGNTQWQIGFPSLLAWSLGIFPFKDDFWTTSDQPGCKYSSCTEPNPVMQTLVAALSAGPVGPSDSIGKLDVDLIMKTCTADGLLLKADKPTTALDSTLLPQPGFNFGSLIQVWDSFTQFGLNRWHFVFAAQLSAGYTVRTADIGLAGVKSVVFDYFLFGNGTQKVAAFDDAHDLQIQNQMATLSAEEAASGVVPFNYYVIAPVLQSQWVLLGEVSKFITVSHQRIMSLTDTTSSLTFTLAGTKGEVLSITLYNSATSSFVTLTPTFSGSVITVTCSSTCTYN
jgi:hypothetical protein